MKNCSIALIASASLVISLFAHADPSILLEEDFEGYGNEAALSAVWSKVGNATTHLAEDPANEDNTVLFSKGDRRHRAFASVTPTDDEPVHLQVEYYDEYEQGVPGRDYIGLWAGPFDSSSLIEVGLHNTAAANETSRYTARVFGSEHGSAWFDLNSSRKTGWRTIDIWVYATVVEIYIDGDLDTSIAWPGGALGAVRLGFGLGTGDGASSTAVRYDNLLVEQLPAAGVQGTLIELSQSGFRGRMEQYPRGSLNTGPVVLLQSE